MCRIKEWIQWLTVNDDTIQTQKIFPCLLSCICSNWQGRDGGLSVERKQPKSETTKDPTVPSRKAKTTSCFLKYHVFFYESKLATLIIRGSPFENHLASVIHLDGSLERVITCTPQVIMCISRKHTWLPISQSWKTNFPTKSLLVELN